MGYARTSWSLVAVTLLTATAGLVVLSPPSPAGAERAAQVAGSLRLSDSTVVPGSEVVLSGKVPPQRARTVKLQTMRDGAWRVLATRESSGRGGFRFTTTGPSQAGDRRYRVLAPATRLGDTRYDAVVTPVRTLTVVAMVATTGGWKHSCALGSDRRAWCWGSNTYGELGDGNGGTSTGEIVSGPVVVRGRGWTALSAMGASTCGVRADDSGWCWGDGATHMFEGGGWVPAPEQLTGNWSQLSAGWFHACGVHTDGTGWCQGRNDQGQLGTALPVNQTTPVQVAGEWRQIVAGGDGDANTTCGIKADRTAWCWGSGDEGQLGNGGGTSSSTPVRVTGEQPWASLSVGGRHVCGLTIDGAGWCWGENTDSRLGDGTVTRRLAPVRVSAAETWSSLDAGHMHTCGVSSDGTGWCFGRNQAGQLGDGTTETVYFPVPDPTQLPGRWTAVTAGFDHTTGVRPSRRAWAWGAAADGQTGRPSEAVSPLPVEVMVEP